jgi:hypothetical protein
MSKAKTGLKFVHVLGCNLTEKEIVDITGWEKYKHHEPGITSFGSRMLKFLVQEIGSEDFDFMALFVDDKPHKSRSGKSQYIDEYGSMSFYLDAPPKDMLKGRVCTGGEASLTAMLQTLVNYDLSGDFESWRSTMEGHGITMANLFEGNVKGMNDFLMYHSERGYQLGVMYTDRNGYTNIETHPDLFFRTDNSGDVPNSYIRGLHEYLDPKKFNPIRGEIDLVKVLEQY